jgi:hypothetical protein
MPRVGRGALLASALASLCLLGPGVARADIILSLAGGAPTPTGSNFTYTYNVALAGGTELDQAGGFANPGNFFTLFDIVGYVSGSATSAATGFPTGAITAQQIGITPPTQGPPDTIVTNLTFHYKSPTEIEAPLGADLALGTVSFESTQPLGADLIFYSAATQKNTPGSPGDESLANNTSLVAGPGLGVTGSPVPAPASMALLGLSLPLLGGYAWARRKLFNLA